MRISLLDGPFDGQFVATAPGASIPHSLGFSATGEGSYAVRPSDGVVESLQARKWHVHGPLRQFEVEGNPRFWTAGYRNTGRTNTDGTSEFQFTGTITHG